MDNKAEAKLLCSFLKERALAFREEDVFALATHKFHGEVAQDLADITMQDFLELEDSDPEHYWYPWLEKPGTYEHFRAVAGD